MLSLAKKNWEEMSHIMSLRVSAVENIEICFSDGLVSVKSQDPAAGQAISLN